MNIFLTVIKFKYFNQKMTSFVCYWCVHFTATDDDDDDNDEGKFGINDVDRRETNIIFPNGRGKEHGRHNEIQYNNKTH